MLTKRRRKDACWTLHPAGPYRPTFSVASYAPHSTVPELDTDTEGGSDGIRSYDQSIKRNFGHPDASYRIKKGFGGFVPPVGQYGDYMEASSMHVPPQEQLSDNGRRRKLLSARRSGGESPT